MCGIAGILHRRQTRDGSLQDALDALLHRGPEAQGIWHNDDQSVQLGHRRLSILDTSADAAQPMRYMDRYIITYNGEVYNYIELKKILGNKGYIFRTHSDTEVIMAAYHEYGKECVHEFEGMFAFAIWDIKEQCLFAARDRLGEKPFFYYYDDSEFVFASEIKALWKAAVPKIVNKGMVYNFITIDYTSNPADPAETFYKGISKLPAASYLHYSLFTHRLQIEKYWQVFPEIIADIAEDDACASFKALFTDSIHKKLRSAVNIGTSLSGGLDSSAIVAYCAREGQSKYTHQCFTASFQGFDKNEEQYARSVAKHFNLHPHILEMKGDDTVNLMERVMHFQDEPITSASVLAQYKIFELARKNNVVVLLDGQGADELLGGYHKYYKWYWQELYAKNKLKSTGELKAARALGITESFSARNKAASIFPEFATSLLQSKKSRKAFRHEDLQEDFAFTNKQNLYYATPGSFDLNGALYFNTFVSGLEELLRYADRNSMASSTEVRLPYLDHHLVRFLFNLPPHLKMHNGWTKWILRKAVESELPSEIVWRKEKTGFEPPQKKWMEAGEVQENIRVAKKKLVAHGILNPRSLQKKIKPHSAYAANNADWKYWSLAFLF